jgi:hypothetical protein
MGVVVVREGGKEFGGLGQRRRVMVGGRGSRGVGCLSEKDLGKRTLEAKRRYESTVPKRPAYMGPQNIYGFDSKNCQDQ